MKEIKDIEEQEVEDLDEPVEGQERREICPNCSRPLMKSRRLKFQMGQWVCAHCGAPWTGSLDLDLETEEQLTEESQEGK
jgi:ribosomal protein L37AE/L43A